jgi:hypothetical protein
MKKHGRVNIFQGNKLIVNTIAETLDLPLSYEGYAVETGAIFFPAFLYLSKKFGSPKVYDDYKDCGSWDIEHKGFTVRVYLNSCFAEIMIFGDSKIYGNYSARKPYWVKVWRETKRKKHLLIRNGWKQKQTIASRKLADKVFAQYRKEFNLPEDLSQEDFNKKYAQGWFEYTNTYNDKIIGIDYKEFSVKYGFEYKNKHTRRALKVLRTVLKSLLAPLWIRDVAYNIKGRLTDDQAWNLRGYSQIKLKR